MELSEIIIGPKITEKTMASAANSKYSMLVDISANKNQIKEALKKIYKVDVVKINIIKIIGKAQITLTRLGPITKKKKARKIAIVVLKKGQKIPGFETEK